MVRACVCRKSVLKDIALVSSLGIHKSTVSFYY